MSARWLLAYDADCGVCRRFKALVEFLDARGRVGFSSLRQAERSGALERIEPALRYRSFHLIAPGRGALSGGDALLPLVGVLLPAGAVVARSLGAMPGFNRAVSFGYSAVSRLHGSGACGAAGD